MPGGIINPKGRNNLNETTRDKTPKFIGESDVKLGLSDRYEDFRHYGKKPRVKKSKKLTKIKDARKAKMHRTQVKAHRKNLQKKKSNG